jgi:hypothetical protein
MPRLCLVVPLLAVLLASAATASAQDGTDQPSLRLPTAVFAGAAAADWIATYDGLSHRSFTEGDVFVRRLQWRPAAMVAAGAGIDAAALFAWNRFVGRRHPRLAAAGLYFEAAFRTYLCVKGVRLIKD